MPIVYQLKDVLKILTKKHFKKNFGKQLQVLHGPDDRSYRLSFGYESSIQL